MHEAQSQPRREYTAKPKPIFDFGDNNQSNGGYSTSVAPPPSRNSGKNGPKIFEYFSVTIVLIF